MKTIIAIVLVALLNVAGAAELKPVNSLPWCRVTLNQAATIDQDAPDLKTYDGWYDAETYVLIRKSMTEGFQPFAPGHLDPARVVKVEVAPHSPAIPAKGLEIANAARRDPEAAKAGDAKRPQTKP